jgi:hypothetical protein
MNICQVAYFVSDARASALKMHRQFNCGPFHVAAEIKLAWAESRGQPIDFIHTSAFGQWGEVMVELVQQDSEGCSPFTELYAPGEEGLHHVAIMVDSLPDTYDYYKAEGYEIALKAQTATGVEFGFIDATKDLGHMIEVYERSEALTSFYAYIKEAAVNPEPGQPFINRG